MEKKLVIVESPSKAKTIKKYLGNNYIVKASVGHIIDLPKSNLGIDLKNNFEPHYITVRGKADVLKEIKNIYKKSSEVLLATDLDREGEAIAWHLQNALNIKENIKCRVIFNEITKKAIKEAIKNPLIINKNLVDAQQSRRILDRIVGYKLSPLLWKKIRKGLSAGRVQSVALKIIIDREKEINVFEKKEYWTIYTDIILKNKSIIRADLFKIDNKLFKINSKEEAEKNINEILNQELKINKINKKEKIKFPSLPFITSTLQQKAANLFNFSSKKTMQIAQQLYEGINLGKDKGGLVGLITYMRTDSTRISSDAKNEAKEYLLNNFNEKYLSNKNKNFYKNNPSSQDAHEGIRPTSIFNTPEKIKNILTKDQFKLYQLIWKRFLSSQMAPAIYEQINIEFIAGKYTFKTLGLKVKFEGFFKIMPELKSEDKLIPELNLKDLIKFKNINKQQHFTQPPLRYTEALLIKQLEKLNIGRPSTYATIIDTIQKRKYINKEKKQFYVTNLGFLVGDLLDKYFKEIINVKFTSNMEKELDLIAEGKLKWKETVKSFYKVFIVLLEKAEKDIKKIEIIKEKEKETDIICDKCGKNMIIKDGRYGKFLACPGFPECKNTKPIIKSTGVKCPQCFGEIIFKRSKKGKIFYGCNNFPKCSIFFWNKPIQKKCLKCGSILLETKKEIICSNNKCDNKIKK